MSTEAWTARRFLSSEYFAEGVRSTVGILLPALVFYQLGHLSLGIPMALGALACSLTDIPGPVAHKRNGLLVCTLVIFSVALLAGVAHTHVVAMSGVILLACFFLSMFSVYGNRAAMIGTAGLLVLVLVMGLAPANAWVFSGMLAAGGGWYVLLSMAFSSILPHRPAQHALGECIRETARFLKLKADFYSPATNLNEDYRNMILQQTVVSEKQDAVREMLLRGRGLNKQSTDIDNVLLLTFVDVVDLYEQIAATQYDYETLRRAYGQSGILEQIGRLASVMADELNEMGWAIQTNNRFQRRHALMTDLEQLTSQIREEQAKKPGQSSLMLNRTLQNLTNMAQRMEAIQRYFRTGTEASETGKVDELEYARFVPRQGYDLKAFRDNLTPTSAIFRHSLRVALVCFFGYALTKYIALGHHSYWVLLTIIVILKPAFSLTKQRNYQRLVGTVIGGILGVIILAVVQDRVVQAILLVFFMIGTFSAQRINYVVSVTLMTPFILIIFSFLGGTNLNLAQERIVDTLLGSAIAFSASYLIFPNWETEKLSGLMQQVVRANISYLEHLAAYLAGNRRSMTEYKLARKEVYITAANLAAAFQRMTSEPKRKQGNVDKIHSFLVLNHILSSNIASVMSSLLAQQEQDYPDSYAQPVWQAVKALQQSLQQLNPTPVASATGGIAQPETVFMPSSEKEEAPLQEQLAFIQKVSQDILKTTEAGMKQATVSPA
ncbi:FUSC family membrane protein [Pontibacter sp. CAU 1760]